MTNHEKSLYTNKSEPATNIPLIEHDSLYLIKQRIENLREQIGLSFNESLELQELENSINTLDDFNDFPVDLGIPTRTDRIIAALEAKRVNRYDDTEYDGGEVNEEDEVMESNIGQTYQALLKESTINVKSLKLLAANKKPIRYQNGKWKNLSVFDIFESAPPKLKFIEFLAKVWDLGEVKSLRRLENETPESQYKHREEWQKYLHERKLYSPFPFQQLIFRCRDFVTSPIYNDMQEIREEQYRLKNDVEMKFTEKTIVFTIPVMEFSDIPQKYCPYNHKVAFVEIAFILPEYAFKRKYYFRKGEDQFVEYLNQLEISLTEKQREFLHDLLRIGSLRVYREVLKLPNRNEIRGYFFNVRKGYKQYSKKQIRDFMIDRFKKETQLNIRRVTILSNHYPEWMRKLGGFIIEEKHGQSVSIPKPLQIGLDRRLPAYSVRWERKLMPSWRLRTNGIPQKQWQTSFLAELRKSYQASPTLFQEYAQKIQRGAAQLQCGCNNGQGVHEDRCPVPVLQEVFEKIWMTNEK